MNIHRPTRFLLPLAIRLTIAAFLGLVTTLVIAFALAVKYEYVNFNGYCTNTMLQFTRQESPGLTVIEGTEIRPEGTPWRAPPLVLSDLRSAAYSPSDYFPALVYNSADTRPLFFIQSGWPARCFWGWDTIISSSTITGAGEGLAPVPDWLDRIWPVYLPLPHLPLWRGLLLDTALFGSAWFALLFVPGLIRRTTRRRRGRCLACGYDLRSTPPGQPCPECGKPRVSGQPT